VQRGVAFRGPWNNEKLENIIKGNRYYLEDKPQWLDEPGEFWVERVGERGRIYLRLPGDVDPNTVTVEAGRHVNFLDATQLNHVHISGLVFRFSNVHWDFNDPGWAHPDIKGAVVRLNGTGDDIRVHNCTFEHVNTRSFSAAMAQARRCAHQRHVGAIYRSWRVLCRIRPPTGLAKPGSLHKNLEMLRNNLYHVGWRIVSGEHVMRQLHLS
jgi:hypothetical protein